MRTDVYALDIETKSRFTEYGETCPWLGQIVGIGLAWGGDIDADSAYYLPESFDEILEWLHKEQTPLVPYNALFEVTWLNYYYPQYKLNWVGDAALYAIALDNSASSFGLKDASGRLVNYEPYEQEYQMYCIENFKVSAKKWGTAIPMMPYEKISRYCRHDCTATWLIWQRGCRELNIDTVMEFFMAEVYMTSEAYTIGTKINVELSQELFDSYYFKFKNAGNEFMQHPELMPHIEIAQRAKYEKKLAADLVKSKTGRVRPPTFEKWSERNPFNPGSDDQLRAVFKSQKLFWDEKKEMFIYPELTEGGVASMAEDYIHLYGVGGEILSESKTNKTKAAKFSNILTDSTYDNRCHFDINLCSVRSTRVSSRGLNIVATSLDDDIGECFVADDGWEYVIFDFCLHPKVEYLTKRGWIPILEIADRDVVWQVNPITLEGSWCKPLRIIKRYFEGDMFHYVSGQSRGSLSVTENHKMLWVGQQDHIREDKRKYRNLKLAQDYLGNPKNCHFAHFSNPIENDLELVPENVIWLACALQADGSFMGGNKYGIQVNKPRKVEKLKELLTPLGIEGKPRIQRDGQNYPTWYFEFNFVSDLLLPGKEKLLNLTTIPGAQAVILKDALCFWDGGFEDEKHYETGRFQYYSTEEKNIDNTQIWFVQNGFEAKKNCCYEGNGSTHKKCWSLSIKNRGTTRFGIRADGSVCQVIAEKYSGMVGCVTVDEGFILVRQEGQTFVTGNCSLEPSVAAILTDDKMLRYCAYFGEGIKPYYKDGVLHVDDTYLCYLSKTKRWREEIMDQFNFDEWMDDPEAVKKRFKKIRQAGKKIVLMTGYGSGVPKVCSSIFKELKIKIGVDEGRELVNVLWAVFPDMWRFICRLRAAANTGRSIPTWLQFPISTNQSVVHCVYNYRCQTEAAHVTKQMIWQMWQRKQDWWIPAVPNIHDANACLVKSSHVEEFKFLLQDSLKDLNDTLAPFTKGIKFRISVHTGKTLREAKEG